MSHTHYHLVVVYGDVEPSVSGPFVTSVARDHAAIMQWAEGDENGIYWLNIKDGVPEIGAYTGGFLRTGET